MTAKPALARCRENLPIRGTFFSLGSPEVIQAAVLCPLDWCLLDWEHGLWNDVNLPTALQFLAASSMLGLVRVPSLAGPWIKKALDWGADGVLVPNIRNAEEARQSVREARYAPLGQRGVGAYRPSAFYTNLHAVVREGNDKTLLWLMIETASMIEDLEEICRMPGIDGFLIGRNDLAQSVGKTYAESASEIDALAERAMTICATAGKPVGCFAGGESELPRWTALGATLLLGGDDAQFIRDGMAAVALALGSEGSSPKLAKTY